jgi:hypothetical protein
MVMVSKIFYRFVFVVGLVVCCDVCCSANRFLNTRGSNCIIEKATAEIGVRETSPNWSPRIKEYLANCRVYSPAYWCSAFVKFILDECNIENDITAWSPTAVAKNVVYQRNRRINQTPMAGDIGSIYFNRLGRVAHVFFIVSWGDKVVTIEGNSNENGSRNGTSVVKKYRMKKTIYSASRWTN